MKWFGERWNPHFCEPEEKVETPVGEACLRCEAPIAAGDQGIVMPFCESVDGVLKGRLVPEHLDCFLDSVLPHAPDCERCRGLERSQHSPSCEYRTGEGTAECSCESGMRMAKLLEPTLTLAEAQTIANEMHVELDYLLAMLKRRRRRDAHSREKALPEGSL